LGIKLNLKPKHYPTENKPAAFIVIAAKQGFDGSALHEASLKPGVEAEWEKNWEDARELGIFGTPNYVHKIEIFWGQDRLEFLDRRMVEDTP
jgi:2-hydroxychromene-2-carboxylate isomerase